MNKAKKIYLDHSATTPVDERVLKAMLPYFTDKFGNASSLHNFGQEALSGVDVARQQVADFLSCSPDEIIFTSGATESDNLAIIGLVRKIRSQNAGNIHIITSKIEHDAVLEPFKRLEKEGIEASYLDVNSAGVVSVSELEKAIQENTALVSLMYVNSEVGSVQPVKEIGKLIEKINEKRRSEWAKRGGEKNETKPLKIYFHTDATQAVNYFDCATGKLKADMLSLSGHKIYGPKGVGALFVKSGTPLEAIQTGGHHERNLRSGTLNVPGIVGLGAAVSSIRGKEREEEIARIRELRNFLVEGIMKNTPHTILNTNLENSSPGHAHFSFLGVEGESILLSLDFENISVSTGSACASGSLLPSHVLMAMGIKQEVCHNSIRFTLGKDSTKEEMEEVIKKLPPIIEKLRKISPEKM